VSLEDNIARSVRLRRWAVSLRARSDRALAQSRSVLRYLLLEGQRREWRRVNSKG
jgi:hypothetical protein